MEPEQKCSFCDSTVGVTPGTDVMGNRFYVCGWCWAYVLHADGMSNEVWQDVRPTIRRARAWLVRRNSNG